MNLLNHLKQFLKKHTKEAFGRFITPLRQGQFRKLVLSRSATYPLPQDFLSWMLSSVPARNIRA